MSFKQVSSLLAVGVVSVTLSAVAYADAGGQGSSPNGPPGPAGNPNQPAGTPQANGPQGPAGNDAQGNSGTAQSNQQAGSHGKSDASHGKSDASHGKSTASHGKSNAQHGKSGQQHPGSKPSSPGNSAAGHSNNFGHGKITICHATKSEKNPYVEITISLNGLHGHGPTDDDAVSRHHAGSWHDIIPAPPGGCPGTVEQGSTSSPTATAAPQQTAAPAPAQPEVAAQAPAAAPGESMVLGARASGGSKPKAGPQNEVLGANASGGSNPPAAAKAAHAAHTGSLPFTGTDLAFVLILAAVALLGGFALRRALGSDA